MSTHSPKVPSYRRHKQSGQAVVTLPDGLGSRRDVLLGQYGTPESHAEYARVIAEWQAARGRVPARLITFRDLTVNEVLVRFFDFADRHYRHSDGTPTGEAEEFRYSVRQLRDLHGHSVATQFGPLALKAVREAMIGADLSRKVVNQRVGRIKRVFKWAVSEELLPAATFQGLQAVSGLTRGRTTARETDAVIAAPIEHIEAVRTNVRPSVWLMIQVQLLTGMRPGEVCQLRTADIDMTGDVWLFRPAQHKTAWRGRERVVAIGPRAQEALRPVLAGRDSSDWLFSPRREVDALRAAQRAARKSKVPASQRNRKKAAPKRHARRRYPDRRGAVLHPEPVPERPAVRRRGS